MALSRATNPFLSSSGAGNVSITSPTANTIAFTTSGTEGMRIDSAGNLGIGTSSPSSYLTGTGVALYRATGDAQFVSSTGSTTNASSLRFYNSTTPQAEIAAGGSAYGAWGGANSLNFLALQNSGAMTFNTTASSITAERMRINAFGIGLGGGVPSSGTGVTFPATQSASSDANTLDDYEEGTFTPNLVNNGTSSTFSAKDGWYRKIGSVVHYWVRFDAGNSGTGGTALQIVNLPFTFLSGTSAAQVGGVYSSNSPLNATGSVNPQGNTNYAYIYYGGAQQSAQATYLSAMITGMTNS
jgi:hypothetical protein